MVSPGQSPRSARRAPPVRVRDSAQVAGCVRGRLRRRPLLIAVLSVGVGGGVLIVALQARPSADSTTRVGLERAYAGTAYAFDGAVCLGSPTMAARVLSVEVEQARTGTTRLVRPPEDARPTIGFPTEDDGRDVAGYRVPAGEADCTLRLLLTPDTQGRVEAGRLRVRMAYGPFGLLRRTAEVTPEVALDVTGTGTDPRVTTD